MSGRIFRNLLFACLLLAALPQKLRAVSLNASVSHVLFFRNGADSLHAGKPYIEFYWELVPNSLHYKKDSSGALHCAIEASIELFSESGTVAAAHRTYDIKPYVPGKDRTPLMLEMERLNAAAGTLHYRLQLKEVNFPASVQTDTGTITVAAPADTPFYSGIQLLDTVTEGADSGPFVRNGKLQLPLAANFLNERTRLGYYRELYQLRTLGGDQGPLTEKAFISRKPKSELILDQVQYRKLDPGTSVDRSVRYFDLSTLKSGNYYLRLQLLNKDSLPLAEQAMFLQLINAHPAETPKASKSDSAFNNPTFLMLDETFVGKFTIPQLQAILRMIAPKANRQEALSIQGFLEHPDELYLRYFIYNHFALANREHPEQAWKKFSDTVKEVNRLFGRNGYETERGMLYLRYGPPAERITVNSEEGAYPYEIWQYYSLENIYNQEAVFLFYKPSMAAQDYSLLHSTVPFEKRNSSWRQLLYYKSANPASKAEQYIRNR